MLGSIFSDGSVRISDNHDRARNVRPCHHKAYRDAVWLRYGCGKTLQPDEVVPAPSGCSTAFASLLLIIKLPGRERVQSDASAIVSREDHPQEPDAIS